MNIFHDIDFDIEISLHLRKPLASAAVVLALGQVVRSTGKFSYLLHLLVLDAIEEKSIQQEDTTLKFH